MLLAALSNAAAGQANLSGTQSQPAGAVATPVVDENGVAVQDARSGKTNLTDYFNTGRRAQPGDGSQTHWQQSGSQAPTSAVASHGQHPSMRFVQQQLPDRKADESTAGDENGPDKFSDKIQPVQGGFVTPTGYSNAQLMANSDPKVAAAFATQQQRNAATAASASGSQTMDILRGIGPNAQQSQFSTATDSETPVGGPAAAMSSFIQGAGLRQDQQSSINAMATSGSTPAQIVQSVKDYQQLNHQADQNAREDFNAQRDLYKADYESSVRDLETANKALDTASDNLMAHANPNFLDQYKANVATAKTAADQAKSTWQNYVKQGPKYAPAAVSQRGAAMQGMMPGSSATYRGQQYQIGQTLTGPDGKKYQIAGFANDGEPQLQAMQ
jgi:hypothetical protein